MSTTCAPERYVISFIAFEPPGVLLVAVGEITQRGATTTDTALAPNLVTRSSWGTEP
ncbi:hypothetical protein [Streptomyces olivoreticuli]|uniref:hypothetical protein n=1 Tax=Streptomyces olivoreticuli TaxID=68246 RepID=UPI0013C2D402|nr:hypothetical protein [Streptomyces olivoreticuli]